MCMDLRQLNLRMIDQRWVMPKIEDLLNNFKGKKVMSSLDLKSGYWNVKVREEDCEKLAFLTPRGLFEWTRMPFGVKTAPMFFQKAMQKVFEGLDFVQIYLDDIVVLSESEAEHKKHLKIVFERLQQYNLKLRLDKCKFAVKELEYLGYIVSGTHKRPTEEYKGKVINCCRPYNKKSTVLF